MDQNWEAERLVRCLGAQLISRIGAKSRPRPLWRLSLITILIAKCGCVNQVQDSFQDMMRQVDISAQQEITQNTKHQKPCFMGITNPSDEGAFLIRTNGVVLDLADSWIWTSPKTYPENHPIHIRKTTQILADGRLPDQFAGRCLVVRGAKNVTIKNANISGFKIAIYAEDCPNLTIENCDVSNNYRQRLKSTPEKEDESDWLYGHENDNDEWLRYGGGIFLKNCDNATIKNCRARNGQNGICLVRSSNATVVGNDMSFMSGWGLAMWRSSKCKIIGNRFDYCVRGYSHGVYARGQDSAGILVYEQCSDNIFAYNHATHGGDGFFLYAGNETVNKTGEGGCNRNLVYMNDFSYAVANGIEATFSDRNEFSENKLHDCVHGIWAGYSSRSLIQDNEIVRCKNGVSIEHGRANRIQRNYISACNRGVWLWWDEDRDLSNSMYAKTQGAESKDEVVIGNLFHACMQDIEADRTENLNSTPNSFSSDLPTDVEDSYIAIARAQMRPGCDPTARLDKRLLEYSLKSANRMLESPPRPLPNIPEGKQHILITEWGPYDFSYPILSPQRATVWNHSTIHVLGNGQPFKIDSLSAGVSAAPMSGTTPADITLRAADADSSFVPYDVSITVEKQSLRATGTIWSAEWAVVYHTWDGSTDPRKGEEFFRRARSFKPAILKEFSDRIDFRWGAGGPTPEVTDHFILVTTSTLKLPVGTWRLRTISDDGVRLYFDGKKVINNWTWHTPTEDTATVTVTEGPHDVRIEYFEIDGNAQLQFFIDPLPAP
jgi:parallel beta-helix repeat protein